MTPKMRPIYAAFLLSFLAVGVGILLGGDRVEDAQLAARYTARVAFPIFLVVYCASSIAFLWPSEAMRNVMRYRRQWGLGFALAHGVHLVALISFFVISGEAPRTVSLALGGPAYVLIALMALTSNDASMRRMGIWWKRLHSLGTHWVWLVFTLSYLSRSVDPERMAQGVALFPIAAAAGLIRLTAWIKRRRRAQAT